LAADAFGLAVVSSDRALLTLAALSGVLGVGGVAVIFGLAGLFGAGGGVSRGHVAVSALVVAYPLMFVSVFLNTAIAAALDGRRLSVGEALAVPARQVGTVALWALIAASVGVLLEQIASRLPLGGSIVVRLVGVGWSLASLFAIPVLALEECSAPQCLKRSAHVVKERWGEGISGISLRKRGPRNPDWHACSSSTSRPLRTWVHGLRST
jgi:hypothetical protein